LLTLNGIQFCDKQTGATADVQINNAIAALPAVGGIVDCRGYGATNQTIANTVNVGSVSQEVTILFDKMTQFNITMSSGAAAFVLNGSSSMIAPGGINPAGSRAQFQVAATANISNVIKTTPTGGAVFLIKGLSFGVLSGAVISDSIINFTGAVQGSVIQDVNIGALFQANYTGLKVSYCSNLLVINYNSTSINLPAVFSANVTAGIQNVIMLGGILVHQGGNPALTIDGTSGGFGATSGFTVIGTQFESNNTADIGVSIKNAVNVHLEGLQFTASTNAGTDAIKIIDSASITANITVDNVYMVNSWTHTINDTITSFTTADSRIAHYTLAESGSNALTNYWESRAGGKTMSVDENGLGLKPLAFSALPSAPNGSVIFCTDCNSTCTAGSSTGRTCFRENGAWTH